jgi:hypothetical protein
MGGLQNLAYRGFYGKPQARKDDFDRALDVRDRRIGASTLYETPVSLPLVLFKLHRPCHWACVLGAAVIYAGSAPHALYAGRQKTAMMMSTNIYTRCLHTTPCAARCRRVNVKRLHETSITFESI